MHRGYIKLFRKLEDWEWYDDLQFVGFFVHLILSANYKDSRYHGHTIPRGSLVFGRKEAAKRFGVGEQVIRTMLARLKSTTEITTSITSRFSIICIVNFEKYQDKSTIKTTTIPTESQPAPNQLLTTSKEGKNVRTQELTSFEGPTNEQVMEYFTELNAPQEADPFFDHFTSNGWRVGGETPMKDWRAASRNWLRSPYRKQNKNGIRGKQDLLNTANQIARAIS
jgi:hypothetical protein